jgi:hypothetical protein
VSQPTFSPASVIADTIVRTVELGVTITNAALDGEATVVWCDLLITGPDRCPGCGTVGVYRDMLSVGSLICRWPGIRCSCRRTGGAGRPRPHPAPTS